MSWNIFYESSISVCTEYKLEVDIFLLILKIKGIRIPTLKRRQSITLKGGSRAKHSVSQ